MVGGIEEGRHWSKATFPGLVSCTSVLLSLSWEKIESNTVLVICLYHLS